ncbi:anti-sigma factor domain-containing protein [Roseomonas sp. 18066]|uniref:anti-sigma factor n=1 Tax=Roseomonas sp. 18066 TaxID=2681412 RepID=UPI001356EA3B|nr:anti-sigma factor [Roseomonas sp. 18066]
MIPEDPNLKDLFAGEYVLGTLEAREAKELEAALPHDADLQASVTRWERRFSVLTAMAEPFDVPPELWTRIERSLDPPTIEAPSATVTSLSRRQGAPWFWRGWALGSSALAAGLAAFIWLQQVPERLTTVLLSQQDQAAWIVEARGNDLQLAALNPQPVDPGRVLQLWALPQGAVAPTSLGLIPPSGQFTVTPGSVLPSAGMLVEITLEPPGGSTTGRPTGPVLFIGRLAAVRGS